jgi:hypothetical protein
MAKILKEMELPFFVFQTKRVAAVRGLEKPVKDQPRQTRRSPTHSRHNFGAQNAPHYVICFDPILRVFQARSLNCQRPPKPIHPISDRQPSKLVGNILPKSSSVGLPEDQKIAAFGTSCAGCVYTL